ncbi:MAG TPA: aminoacyl-tRNA hydrolase [Anaerolineae bacterium]|nr:aminoacyl-tRNA hydrolase [Anaerolineae bacterium]
MAGLGNPGPRYQDTRHNAGFWWLDEVARSGGVSFKSHSRFHGEVARLELAGRACWLLKPATFMNLSGRAVAALAHYYKIPPEAVLVAHDELDLPPGTARLKQGGGHGGHNGLRSTMSCLGSSQFLRLRLGIGHPGHKDQVTDYVLGKPAPAERRAMEQALAAALGVVPELLAGDLQRAMHRLHSIPA